MTTATLTLAEFLLARIAEDEERCRQEIADGYGDSWENGYNSHRVLAECDAKRRFLALLDEFSEIPPHVPILSIRMRDRIPRLLALPYADHPDYRDEWRP